MIPVLIRKVISRLTSHKQKKTNAMNAKSRPDSGLTVPEKSNTSKAMSGQIIRKNALTPSQIIKEVSTRVIGHEHAKASLASAIYWNQHTTVARRNVLLLGPPHAGMTTLVREFSRVTQLPYVIPDLSDYLLPPGTTDGKNPNDMVSQLLRKIEGRRIGEGGVGIILLEGAEQLAAHDPETRSRKEAAQLGLARIACGKTIHCVVGGKLVDFDTTKILFVASIDSAKLERAGSKQVHSPIGFGASVQSPHSTPVEITTDDLVRYGFLPEFLAAFDIRSSLRQLNETELLQVCQGAHSPLHSFLRPFSQLGVVLEFSDVAIHQIARQASSLNSGVQGVFSVAHALLDPVLMHVANSPDTIQKVVVHGLDKVPEIHFGACLIPIELASECSEENTWEMRKIFRDGLPRRPARSQSTSTEGRLANEEDLKKWMNVQ